MMWKEIEIDKKYLINENGTIKRIEFLDKRGYRFPEITLSVHISQGYPTVTINGIPRRLHRLLAEAFIPNPENKKEVNHINGNRADFSIPNLEWVTRQENQIHSWKFLNRKATWAGKTGFQHHAGRAVNQYDIDGNLINIFGSSAFAAKSQGYHQYAIDWAIKTKAGYYKGHNYSYASL